jgi:hypothetical protein
MDQLSFEIDDNASWPTLLADDIITQNNEDNIDGAKEFEPKPFPSVIDVSISLKVIENPAVKQYTDNSVYQYGQSDEQKYSNYFTGYNPLTYDYDEVTKLAKIEMDKAVTKITTKRDLTPLWPEDRKIAQPKPKEIIF